MLDLSVFGVVACAIEPRLDWADMMEIGATIGFAP